MLRSGNLSSSRLCLHPSPACVTGNSLTHVAGTLHPLSLCAAGADVHVLQAMEAHSRMSDSSSVLQEWGTPMSTLPSPEGRPSGSAFSPLAATLFPASGSVGLPGLHSQLSLQCLQGQPVFLSSVQHSAWLALQHSARVDPAAWAASRKQMPMALLCS